jgi:hypothetical protein
MSPGLLWRHMTTLYSIPIKGLEKKTIVLEVSDAERAFIELMMRNRSSDHYFALGSHIVKVEDELEEVSFDDEM